MVSVNVQCVADHSYAIIIHVTCPIIIGSSEVTACMAAWNSSIGTGYKRANLTLPAIFCKLSSGYQYPHSWCNVCNSTESFSPVPACTDSQVSRYSYILQIYA